jgi:hypothetical protein
VVIGFRSTGAMSIYFGGDPVYQFDADNRLRRAFCEGRLYRTQGTGLACLVRERTDTETVLNRTDLSPSENHAFVEAVELRLRGLSEAFVKNQIQIVGHVPADYDLREQVLKRLGAVLARPIELAPALPTRRT